jgi:NAD(P)-dependent dehydrogenase (short-subunit alcohol dehydrogenase family)
MRGLKDKVAIVAGAAPGNIGEVTAVRLAEEGAAVVAADLNEAAAQSPSKQAFVDTTGTALLVAAGILLVAAAWVRLRRAPRTGYL